MRHSHEDSEELGDTRARRCSCHARRDSDDLSPKSVSPNSLGFSHDLGNCQSGSI
ncbi:hypothetical protein DAI22_08g172601 [Oryza sativa Japonica Group]|nr:hypothetical protein DAI22_08g172601 [Oryza sativa Japonica Group]